MAGKIMSGWTPQVAPAFPTQSKPQTPLAPTSPVSSKGMNTYPASILQAGQDYDALMGRYKDMLDKGPSAEYGALVNQYKNSLTNNQAQYTRSPDMAAAGSNLADLAKTGGYSEQGIADLRSRGISPIRAAYANAQRGIDRQRALGGGYSPNYTAATAKLTRGLSDAVSEGTQNVNAGIAQNVASNRLGAGNAYGSFAGNETGMMNQANQFNAGNRNANLGALSSLYMGEQGRQQNALEGMRSLYGTTPANPALYGQQALNIAQLEEQAKQRKQQGGIALSQAYGNAIQGGAGSSMRF